MNLKEFNEAVTQINYNGSKATNHMNYLNKNMSKSFWGSLRKFNHQQDKQLEEFGNRLDETCTDTNKSKWIKQFFVQQSLSMQNEEQKFQFLSPRLDIMYISAYHHSYYRHSINMINDLCNLLTNKPQNEWIRICHDIYDGYICFQCALLVLLQTNNLKLFFNHIQKYGEIYKQLFKQKPMSFCNELMNLWTITTFFVQILNHPRICKCFISKKMLFNRVMLLLHWFIDNWRTISYLENNQLKKESKGYKGYSIHTVIKHNEHLMEQLYTLIGQIALYLRKRQVKWYLMLGKNSKFTNEFIQKYVISRLKPLEDILSITKSGYSWNMYIIFTCHMRFLISRLYSLGKWKIFISNHLNREQIVHILGHSMQPVNDVIQRMNQCHYRNFLFVKCSNPKCNKKYWYHVYGIKWLKLRLFRNKHAKLPKDLRVNKWYNCSGCLLTQYCSRRCQKYHWNMYFHKQICLQLQQL